ncbi:MAG: YlxR family protein [Actinomycetia bacterium]|nr:YlxR family protein [Actinomycetes bacterium]
MTGRPDASPRPQRTCVGCRQKAAAADLLRLVLVDGSVTPDPRRRLPGRGAHLHLDQGCLDLAERRRAFPRAFRVPGPLDTSPLRAYVEGSPAGTPAEHRQQPSTRKRVEKR